MNMDSHLREVRYVLSEESAFIEIQSTCRTNLRMTYQLPAGSQGETDQPWSRKPG